MAGGERDVHERRRLGHLFIVIPLIALFATILGFFFSFRLDFPTGPFIASALAIAALLIRLLGSFAGR